MDLNIMMDPNSLFPDLFHPEIYYWTVDAQAQVKPRSTRTRRPVKYYLIDFGLSGFYNPLEGQTIDMPVLGGDKTVPEFQGKMDEPHEVYPTDVYYVGNMVRESFLQVKSFFATPSSSHGFNVTEIPGTRVYAVTCRRHGAG